MAFSRRQPGVSVPASDPYALSVGGTSLGLGQAKQRLFETGWSNDDAYCSGVSGRTRASVVTPPAAA